MADHRGRVYCSSLEKLDGATEWVDNGHGTDDRDLIAADTKWGKLNCTIGGRFAKTLKNPSASRG